MNSKIAYSTPEVVTLGDAAELTEGGGREVVAEVPGSGVYWDPNPPAKDSTDDENNDDVSEDEEESEETEDSANEDDPETKR